jgi:hypothetical protein
VEERTDVCSKAGKERNLVGLIGAEGIGKNLNHEYQEKEFAFLY